jgi:hypothetical protein
MPPCVCTLKLTVLHMLQEMCCLYLQVGTRVGQAATPLALHCPTAQALFDCPALLMSPYLTPAILV